MADQYPQFISDQDEEQKKVQKPATLATAVANSAATGDVKDPMDPDASKHYLGQLKSLSDQAASNAATPPETRKSLADAMSRAEELYKGQASKNEWLELAQIIARAGTQLAAAQSGMAHGSGRGRDMSGIDQGPTIDYGERTNRSFREYQQGLGNLEKLSDAQRREYEDSKKLADEDYARKARFAEKGLNSAEEERRLSLQDKREDDRQSRAERHQTTSEDRQMRALQAKDLEQQEKEVRQSLSAALALTANKDLEEDLSSRDAGKLQQKYGDLAGKAGIDLNAVAAEAEKAPEVDKSILGFKYKGSDPQATHKALMSHVENIKKSLAEIRARKEALLAGSSNKSAPSAASSPPPPKQISADQLAEYSRVHSMEPEAARKYLESQGFQVSK